MPCDTSAMRQNSTAAMGSLPWHSRCSHFGDPRRSLQAASRKRGRVCVHLVRLTSSRRILASRGGGVRSGGRPPCGAYPPRGRSGTSQPVHAQSADLRTVTMRVAADEYLPALSRTGRRICGLRWPRCRPSMRGSFQIPFRDSRHRPMDSGSAGRREEPARQGWPRTFDRTGGCGGGFPSSV